MGEPLVSGVISSCRYLTIKETISLRQLSRYFAEVVWLAPNLKSLDFYYYRKGLNESVLSFLFTRIPVVNWIDFSGVKNLTPGVLNLIGLRYGTSFRGISFFQSKQEFPLEVWSDFFQLCPNLEVLMMERNRSVCEELLELASLHLPRLRVVNFSNCLLGTGRGLQALFTRCHSVRSVSLASTNLTEAALLPLTRLPLKRLALGFTPLRSAEVLAQLISIPTLRILDLSAIAGSCLPPRNLELLAQLKVLKILDLTAAPFLNSALLLDILHNNPGLEILNVSQCRRLTDAAFPPGLVHICAGLRKLVLSGCHRLSDSTLASVCALPDLRDLKLSGLRQLTAAGIGSLAFGACRSLARLDLSKILLDEEALVLLANELRHLETVNVRQSGMRLAFLDELRRSFPSMVVLI